MKRLIIPLLALCGLFSCSTDDDTAPDVSITPGGLFVASDETQMIGVWVVGGYCTEMIVYQKGSSQFVVSGFKTNGEWPTYTYSNAAFQMSVTFNDEATAFVADYNGIFTGNSLGYNPETITLTTEGKNVKFTLTNEPIDANGDGIPDVME